MIHINRVLPKVCYFIHDNRMLAERAFYCCLGIWLRIAAECEENLKKENRQPVTGC